METEISKDSELEVVGAASVDLQSPPVDVVVIDQLGHSSEQVDIVKPEQLVYFGPTLPNGILGQFTTFKGGLPRHVENLVESVPVLKSLFVTPSQLNLSRVKLADSSSPEWASFQEVKAHFNKGVR